MKDMLHSMDDIINIRVSILYCMGQVIVMVGMLVWVVITESILLLHKVHQYIQLQMVQLQLLEVHQVGGDMFLQSILSEDKKQFQTTRIFILLMSMSEIEYQPEHVSELLGVHEILLETISTFRQIDHTPFIHGIIMLERAHSRIIIRSIQMNVFLNSIIKLLILSYFLKQMEGQQVLQFKKLLQLQQ